MKPNNNKWSLRVLAVAGLMLVSIASTFIAPDSASAAGCRTTDVGMNNGYNTNQYAAFSSGSVAYWYTDWIASPSWAYGCRDVNINYVSVPGDIYGGQCVLFRAIRQYDMRASGWTTLCPWSGERVIFYNIYGSKYRVETKPTTQVYYRPYYMIKD